MLDKILMGIILALAIIVGTQNVYISHLREENTALKSQIQTLEEQNKQETERFSNAYDQAETQMLQVKGQTHLILAEKVSPKCDDAIKWGINEAHNFT